MSHQHQNQRNRPLLVRPGEQETPRTPLESMGLNEQSPTSKSNSPLLPSDSFPPTLPQENLNSLPPPVLDGSEKSENSTLDIPDYMAPLSGRNLKRAQALSGFYVLTGSLAARVNLYDGVLIIKGAEDRATEVIRVAMQHPGMMKVIDAMIEGNVYFNLAMGHGVMLMAILMNHGRIPLNEGILSYFQLMPNQVIPQSPVEETPVKPARKPRKSRVAASV
jgi:hypothetical protein